jgi:hypothetical protein
MHNIKSNTLQIIESELKVQTYETPDISDPTYLDKPCKATITMTIVVENHYPRKEITINIENK